ncbi:MAG TPA: purine-nucleoside phosphorylase [Candidatus Faecisoma merdavium]|nr:purine-nucleoside phosphorylase [Candidatus Faecisoma merdavium]
MIETPHIKCNKEDISKIVLMPGDPLRAKFIAQTYLKDYKLVNSVRNMLAYTGFYKGKKITVFSSGMGMASMGIYCYELYKFFDVKYIIRIGSCGSTDKDVKLLDTILSTSSYTETNFSYTYSSVNVNEVNSSEYLNNIIINKNKNIKRGKTVCSMVFDAYIDNQDEYNKRLPQNVLAVEMEAFALFYIAKLLNKEATCLLTVSDSLHDKKQISSSDRQLKLKEMIEIALEASLEVE